MKRFSLFLLLLLAGCSKSNVERDGKINIDGLKDCKVYIVTPCDNCTSMWVARCPFSTTTTYYRRGKSGHVLNVVVEGGDRTKGF